MYERLRSFALSFPGAHEDFPWGERVVKVDGKVFVFMGIPPEGHIHLSLKLPHRAVAVLDRPYCSPTGYGLGKAGWVSVSAAEGELDERELRAWIDESYRAVAKKRRIAELAAKEAT
ncbi:MAG: MmcQ/YjbR family DNA-binding protein [Myxococcota bacterium]